MMRFLTHARAAAGVALLSAVVGTGPASAQQAPAHPAPPAPVAFHLHDGTVVVGEVLSEDAGKIQVRTQKLGEITIDADDVEYRGSSAEPVMSHVAVHAAAAAAPPVHAAASWTRAITASAALVSPSFTQGELAGGVPGLTGATLGLPGAQANVDLGFTVNHTSPDDTIAFGGSLTYADNEPIGRVSEGISVHAQYSRVLTKRTYLISTTTFRRDRVRHIDNSFVELAGLGVKLIEHPRFRLDVVGGGAVLRENKDTPFDDTVQPQLGASESFVLQINPRSSVSHRIVYRVGVREPDVWNFESQTSLQAAITSHLSLVVGLTWNYDNVLGFTVTPVPPDSLGPGSPALSLLASQKTFRQITSGVQFTF